MWCVILVSFVVKNGEYGNGAGIIFGASLAQWMAVLASFLL